MVPQFESLAPLLHLHCDRPWCRAHRGRNLLRIAGVFRREHGISCGVGSASEPYWWCWGRLVIGSMQR
ncbi:hypothetical protein EJB05_01969 [Eragrostis curvula]|uniref:Uncharacterized protein n=1 Tax=Eragrostis curvula TaxID=38414 RepID=A0A5J9WPB5_9POAL|nr:hypothetical protein EJB05_01969 [Eragrostis curvula]